jgi:hypothetical protein
MQINVTQAEDFFRVVEPAYDRLLKAAGDDTLEIVFAPGHYDGELFKVIDRFDKGTIAVHVRAADPALPPLITDGIAHIAARAIRLEHIIVADSMGDSPLITLNARDEILLDHCAFVNLRRGAWPPSDPLAEICPAFNSNQPRLIMRDCWWMGNRGEHSPFMAMRGQYDMWAEVTFERVVFLDNGFDEGIGLAGAVDVRFDNCLLHTPPIQVAAARTELQITGSLLVGEEIVHNTVDAQAVKRIGPADLLVLADGDDDTSYAENRVFPPDAIEHLDLDAWLRHVRGGAAPDIEALAAALSG